MSDTPEILYICTFLGDGVTARWDGVDLILTTPREDGEHMIVLGPREWSNLLDFVKALTKRDNDNDNNLS